MINGGSMVALLVRNHKLPSLRRITWSAGGTLRLIYGYAVLNERDPLQSERNFEAQPIWRWPAAEKKLCGPPVTRFCGNIQRRHLIAARQPVPVGSCIEQRAQVILLSKPRGKHHDGKISVVLNVTAQRLRWQQREKILIATRWKNRVGICSAAQKRAKKRGVVSRDRIGKKRHVPALRRRRR